MTSIDARVAAIQEAKQQGWLPTELVIALVWYAAQKWVECRTLRGELITMVQVNED